VDLDQPEQFVVGGHDVRRTSYREAVHELQQRSNIFDRGMTDACQEDLHAWGANVRPGTVFNTGTTITRLADLPEVQRLNDPRIAFEHIQADLRSFQETHKLDQVVVINVASTEPPFELREVHQSLDRMLAPVECHEHSILPASAVYAWAVLDMGWPYINFTPS